MSLEVWRTLLFSRKTSSVIGNPMFGTLVWDSSLHFREVKTSKQSRGYLVRKTSQEQKTLGHWILSNEVLKKKLLISLKLVIVFFRYKWLLDFLTGFHYILAVKYQLHVHLLHVQRFLQFLQILVDLYHLIYRLAVVFLVPSYAIWNYYTNNWFKIYSGFFQTKVFTNLSLPVMEVIRIPA